MPFNDFCCLSRPCLSRGPGVGVLSVSLPCFALPFLVLVVPLPAPQSAPDHSRAHSSACTSTLTPHSPPPLQVQESPALSADFSSLCHSCCTPHASPFQPARAPPSPFRFRCAPPLATSAPLLRPALPSPPPRSPLFHPSRCLCAAPLPPQHPRPELYARHVKPPSYQPRPHLYTSLTIPPTSSPAIPTALPSAPLIVSRLRRSFMPAAFCSPRPCRPAADFVPSSPRLSPSHGSEHRRRAIPSVLRL